MHGLVGQGCNGRTLESWTIAYTICCITSNFITYDDLNRVGPTVQER